MKNRNLKLMTAVVLVLIGSCNRPETVVTNVVHPDGSVTRRIEMRHTENKFDISGLQVPFDSTWIIKDSVEINGKGDTIWVKRAEKLFKSTGEINRTYKADSSYNRVSVRSTEFGKKFKWFNTEYRFAERIEKRMNYGYPAKDFLNEKERLFFYSPESFIAEKLAGADSVIYKAIQDSVDRKSEFWLIKSAVSEWIATFVQFAEKKSGNDISVEALKAREDEFTNLLIREDDKFDSLWANGSILKEFIGEARSLKYKAEADTAMSLVLGKLLPDFENYSVRISMPGKVIRTNGYPDSTKILSWPVKSDYFTTESYEMWAESREPNRWAWIISGVFILSVITGIFVTKKGKG